MARNTQVAADHHAPAITQMLARFVAQHPSQGWIEHAIGSLQRAMTDAQLEAKFTELSTPVIGTDKTKALIAAAWNIDDAANVRALTAIARP